MMRGQLELLLLLGSIYSYCWRHSTICQLLIWLMYHFLEDNTQIPQDAESIVEPLIGCHSVLLAASRWWDT